MSRELARRPACVVRRFFQTADNPRQASRFARQIVRACPREENHTSSTRLSMRCKGKRSASSGPGMFLRKVQTRLR